MLTPATMISRAESLLQVFDEPPGTGRRLSYLPLSHIAERMTSDFVQMYNGVEVWFAESIDTLLRDLVECKPTVFFAVPRVWEKFHQGIKAKLAALPDEQRQMAEGAIEISKAVVEIRQEGEEPIPEMLHGLEQAEAALFAPARAALGLDQCHYFVSGAAPINVDILKFFHAIGIPIAEVYGQTEDCGPTTLNPNDRIKIGTVGPAIPGVEVRIAEDGEVLVRGGDGFPGSSKDDEGTAGVFRGGGGDTRARGGLG